MSENTRIECCHCQPDQLISEVEFNKIKFSSIQCEKCEEQQEIMICLFCGKVFCSDEKDNHFKAHLEENKTHSIFINVSDKQIRCFLCEKGKDSDEKGLVLSNETVNLYRACLEVGLLNAQFENAFNDLGEDKKEDKKELTEKEIEEIQNNKYEKLVQLLKSNSIKKIAFMVGAGISTASGIPDFRSSGGIFEKLQKKYGLEYAETVFELSTFFENQTYFNEFSREFLKESFEPTKFHYFMGFLCDKKLVKYVFTQNIDCLESKSIIDQSKVIYAHGNFLEAHCPTCKANIDFEDFNKRFLKGETVLCLDCKKPCKYKIVFYGEALPLEFFKASKDILDVDLAIVSGTSLKVYPFNNLPNQLKPDAWRAVVDICKVGYLNYDDSDSKDVFIKSNCEDFVAKIVKDCGWEKEFEDYIKKAKQTLSKSAKK